MEHAITTWATDHSGRAQSAGILAATVCAALVLLYALRSLQSDPLRTSQGPRRRKLSAGTAAAVCAFVICTSVSLNTSYRFTGDPHGLAMTGTKERILACAAFESLMAMCVLGARERLGGPTKSPGWFGSAVWIFAGLSSVPAFVEGAGLTAATLVRIIVGAFGSALAAHSALGLELRHRTGGESETPSALILRDLRERLMARFGVTQRNRTAQSIVQERAFTKAVDLWARRQRGVHGLFKGYRDARLARRLGEAQQKAGIAQSAEQRGRYYDACALRQHGPDLSVDDAVSLWRDVPSRITAAVESSADRLTREAERIEEEAGQLATAMAPYLPPPRTVEPASRPSEPREKRPLQDVAAAYLPRAERITTTVQLPQPSRPEGQGDSRSPYTLANYPTKTAALRAAVRETVAADDPRTNNAIATDLTKAHKIDLDRGSASKVVAEVLGRG